MEEGETLLNTLSDQFGEAQFFGTHRVVGLACWVKSIKGEIKRFYSYLGERGESLMVKGEPTAIEKQYNFIDTTSEEAKDPKYFEREDITYPDEEEVMTIAGAWSINPTTLDERKDIPPALGYINE